MTDLRKSTLESNKVLLFGLRVAKVYIFGFVWTWTTDWWKDPYSSCYNCWINTVITKVSVVTRFWFISSSKPIAKLWQQLIFLSNNIFFKSFPYFFHILFRLSYHFVKLRNHLCHNLKWGTRAKMTIKKRTKAYIEKIWETFKLRVTIRLPFIWRKSIDNFSQNKSMQFG